MNGLDETLELRPNSGAYKVTSHCLDVADRQAVADYAGQVIADHQKVDLLFNNPGSHLINISSVFGLVAPPEAGSYVISEFAVRGYTEALRSELREKNVHVSCVHPGMIATNIVAAADAPDDVVETFARSGLSADKAARKILKGVVKKKARIRVASHTYCIDCVQRLLPSAYRVVLLPLLGLKGAADSK